MKQGGNMIMEEKDMDMDEMPIKKNMVSHDHMKDMAPMERMSSNHPHLSIDPVQ